MQRSDVVSSAAPPATVSPWRDVALVALITLGCVALAAWFELGEAVFEHTRRWEHVELDEWPVAAFVLSLSLMWISWRRYRQAVVQLEARRAAEAQLAAALAENRELAHQHLRIQEAERKHLARELHDELGQYLNAIKLDAVSLRHARAEDHTAQAAARIEQAVDHVHGIVSHMISRLRPVGLDELGLLAALENCIDHWRQRLPGTHIAFETAGDLDDLGEVLNLTLFRLIQEALTNAYKHAGASRIDIRLLRADEVVLTVADNGRGMNPDVRPTGFGIAGMRERVEMLGGTFSVRSGAQGGFTIEAHLPVARPVTKEAA